ncbi:MAG: filamentous hemagglutinin N-terminal domain-containing protein [Candidatus Omnitrophica bacterium]|nr:filamentous hemagglutinin N-terminal domain-containing protein [Candidatus Omnitrophota bacterium]
MEKKMEKEMRKDIINHKRNQRAAKLSVLKAIVLILLCGPVLFFSRNSFALPEVGEVVSGDVQFSNPNPQTLQINASDKAIINFNSFNINENESVIVNLPNASNEVLSRVIGQSSSSLLGGLICNGIFVLTNPNGINIGPNARVDAAGFIASTRDITNKDFLDDQHIFSKVPGKKDTQLVNQGTITIRRGGFGILIAGAVKNEGVIAASVGTVALAAGDKVSVNISGDGLVSVNIDEKTAETILDANGKPIADQIKNTGTLEANGGQILLKAQSATDIFHAAINLEGVAQAGEVEEKDGKIVLKASGDIILNATAVASAVDVQSDADIIIEKDVIATSGDVALNADYDGDGAGQLTQAQGTTIEAQGNGNVYLDGSGAMALATVKTENGSIKVGTRRAPSSIIGDPHYVHGQGDFVITQKQTSGQITSIETERGDVLRYDSVKNLTLEAPNGIIKDLTAAPVSAGSLTLIGQGFEIDSTALSIELYKLGNLEIHNTTLEGNTARLVGDGVNVSYLVTANLTLKSDNVIDTSPGVIIQANQVRLVSRQFGTLAVPLEIHASLITLQRTLGSIDIMESIGMGEVIAMRAPPNGFGAIVYNRDTTLVLEAESTTLLGTTPTNLYGNITFTNFNLTTPDKEIYFEAGKVYTFVGSTTIIGALDAGPEEYHIKLRSQTPGSQYFLNIESAEPILSFLNIKDANAINHLFVPIGVQGGNNTNIEVDPIWDGGGAAGDYNWSTGLNWSGNIVPQGPLDTVSFNTGLPGGSNKNCTIDAVDGTWTGDINIKNYTGTITQTAPMTVTGNISMQSGTYIQNGDLIVTGTLSIANGIYTQTGSLTSANFSMTNGTDNQNGDFTVTNFTITGGTFTSDGVTPKTFSATSFALNGGTFSRFAGGTGIDADHPYQIFDVYGLQAIRCYLGSFFILKNDINAAVTSNWDTVAGGLKEGFISIGNSGTPFTGSLDGDGRTISGLYINRSMTHHVGFFGNVSGGTLANVFLTGVNITGQDTTGGFVGENNSTITNCYTTGSVTGADGTGGFVGVNYLTITNCYSTATMSANGGVGGFVGGNAGTITNCYSAGSVTGTGWYDGGFAGRNTSVIRYCFSTGNVIGGALYTGGFIGQNLGTITDCYSRGSAGRTR